MTPVRLRLNIVSDFLQFFSAEEQPASALNLISTWAIPIWQQSSCHLIIAEHVYLSEDISHGISFCFLATSLMLA